MLTSAQRELLKKYIEKNCLQNISKTLKIFVQKVKKSSNIIWNILTNALRILSKELIKKKLS